MPLSEPSQAGRTAPLIDKLPIRRAAGLVAASTAVGGLVMVVSTLVLSGDPAANLAATLGLGSGIALGALLGGLFGGWLALGGLRRLAATCGFFVAVGLTLAAWNTGRPYLWAVDVVMNAVFGEGGDLYSTLVIILIAIPIFRTIASAAAALLSGLLCRRSGQAREASSVPPPLSSATD